MRLRLKEQKGPRCGPQPWSQRAGDLTWEPSRLPGLEWVGQMSSTPLLLLPDGSSSLPLLISLACLLCPQGPTHPGGGFGGGYRPENSAASPARVGQATAFHSPPALPRESLPPASPDLPGLRGANLSGFHFSSHLSPSMSYQFTWGFLPSPWASESPTSSRQAP